MKTSASLVGCLLLLFIAPASSQILGLGDALGDRGSTLPVPGSVVMPGRFGFRTGFNQAWLGRDYGHQWGRDYDRVEAEAVLEKTAELGGTIVRMWLFEGMDPDGVLWDGARTHTDAPLDRHRGRPTGYSRQHLENLEHFLQAAEARGVQVYLTLFTGNFTGGEDRPGYRARKAEWWNMFHDLYRVDELWRSKVLAQVCRVLARHPDAVYAIDLMNEGNALVERSPSPWLADGWTTFTAWVRRWRRAIHRQIDVPVGVSFGHHIAVRNFLDGVLPENAVDFYDIHAYNDSGTIRQARRVEAKIRRLAARGMPVLLGEFGQSTRRYRNRLQVDTTRNFLDNASRMGFAAALAWRLQDIRDDRDAGFLTFCDGDVNDPSSWRWRPATRVFRERSEALARRP